MSFEFNPFSGNFDKVRDIEGTTNQVNVNQSGDKFTLSTPQDIDTGATPQFEDVQVIGAGLGNRFVGKTLAQLSSTGVIKGLNLAINVDPTKFDISAGDYEIVDNYTDPENPVVKKITYAGSTGNSVTNLATSDVTYILLNDAGVIIQQTNFPTPDNRRDYAFVGRLSHTNRTSIAFADTFPDIKNGIVSQFFDLCDAMAPFKISGLEIATVGTNLSFQRTSGSVFFRSANYSTDLKNPHTSNFTSSNPQSFKKMTQSSFVDAVSVTVVEPNYYDVGGVRTLNPSGNGSATIQRVFLYKSGLVGVAYGQQVYSNLANALAAISTDPFIPNPSVQQTAILIGYIVLTKDCNNLQDTNKARVLTSSKFGTSAGAVTGGVTSLQQAYNNSTLPKIILNALQGALTIDDASTPIGTLLDIRNNAGTVSYARVDANGLSTVNFEATGTNGAVKFHNLTTTERDALTPTDGMMIYNTTLNQFQVYFNSAWQSLATESNSLVITNKDIDGGTASNTSRSTIPRAATIEAAAALVRKKATLLYNDFTNKFLKDNGTDLKSIPDFGDVNIFAQEIAADNVIGSWTQNLSGVTATFTKGTDSRLGTCYKLDITSASSGTGGTYTVRKDFAVPEGVRGTFVELSYDYVSTVSKTGTCVILYDVTNSVAIVPQTDIQAQPDPTSLVTKGFITFSIPSTCETLRVFIGRSLDASAIAISNQYFYFNNLQFKKFTQAIAITEGPKSHIRFGNGGNRGSTNTQVVYFTELPEKNGSGLSYVSNSTVGTLIYAERSGILDVSMTRNQPVSATGMQIVKNISAWSASNTSVNVIAGYNGSSGAGVQGQMSGKTRVVKGDYVCIVAETNTSNANTANTFSAVLHEDNLSARYADYTLNQDVSFVGFRAASTAASTTVNVKADSVKDTVGAWDAVNGEYEVKSAGDFDVEITAQTSTSGGALVYKNGTNTGYFIGASWGANGVISGSVTIPNCVVGDKLSIRLNASFNLTNSYISVSKRATSQQLFAPIAQRYVVKTYQSGTSWYEVYNDGWVRQGLATSTTADTTFTVSWLIQFKDTNYSAGRDVVCTSLSISNPKNATFLSKSTTDVSLQVTTFVTSSRVIGEGYGNSAAVKALGANPSYG